MSLQSTHQNLIAIPPDGGWGWVVVGVSFYGMIIIDLPSMGFQVLLPHLMDRLGMQASQVSIILSVYLFTMFSLGPVAGGVCNRFGFRTTTLIGSLLMIIGLITSFFFSDYISLCILFGVIAGSGTSFIMLMSSVAPGFWFESKRAIAMGLVSSASGISLFSVPLSKYVGDTFGWKWCFIFWAGLSSILFGLAFLLAPPPMVELEAEIPLVSDSEDEEVDITRITSMRPLRYDNQKVQLLAEKKLLRLNKMTGIPFSDTPQERPYILSEEEEGGGEWKCCRFCKWCQHRIGYRPLYRKDIFYTGNLIHAANVEKKEKDTFALSMVKLPTTKDVMQEVECHCKCPEAVTRSISEMLDFSLFKSTIFLLILGSSVFIYIGRFIPFIMIERLNKGLNREDKIAGWLTSIMGLGAFISRGSIGFFLHVFHNISSLSATIMFALLGGLALCCIPLSYWLPYQIVMCFCAGALPSTIVILRSIVIIDMLGLDKLTNSTGILYFIQGFASFLGLPIAELLNEKTHTMYAGLIFSGVLHIVAGLFYVVIAFTPTRRKRNVSLFYD